MPSRNKLVIAGRNEKRRYAYAERKRKEISKRQMDARQRAANKRQQTRKNVALRLHTQR